MDHFSKTPLFFSLDEQKALIHDSIFAQESGYPFTEALNRAIDKLKRYANENQVDRMQRHADGLTVIHPQIDDKQQSFLQLLEVAAANGQLLEMEYSKGAGSAARSRRLDPYGIVHWKGSWYTVGFCHLRQELRSFRVDRIVHLSVTEQYFERPAVFSAKHFLMSSLLPNSVDAPSLLTVRIQGCEQVLNELCRHWLFGEALIERTAGQAKFKLGVESCRIFFSLTERPSILSNLMF